MLTAKVKSVLSGDTLILSPVNPKSGVSQSERTLSLAFVSSPRLSGNETHGFQSREYLRTLVVGKPIQFKVLYTVNDREYGDIKSPAFDSLIERLLANGIVKLRNDASSKDSFDSYHEKLNQAQASAETAHKGLWAEEIKSIIESRVPSDELSSSSRQFPSIVERVISGDRLQVRVLIHDDSHFIGQVVIAGVRAPRSTSSETPGEPYGDVSKQFVESRLLQRSVKLQFLAGTNTSGLPVVKVLHPAGDISTAVLKAGLATVADWQSHILGIETMVKLREFEKSAKDAKLNIWKGTESKIMTNKNNYHDVIIAKVLSPDTYVIRIPASNEERTVQLASIRAPRKNDAAQEPFVAAAKEFARSKFIAKKVNVELITVRPKSDQFEERDVADIIFGGTNIAATIVENGWATVIRHRKDDDDRSRIWDQLIQCEASAIEAKKGMHSKKPPPSERLIDASESTIRAKGFLPSLERQTKIPAVVDYISSGGRFRLLVARENCVLTLVLAGIRVPRPQEEFGEVARDFVSKRLWQRDVQVSVIGIDKTGAFTGHVFLPGSSIPLSVVLVKEGLASVHEYSAQQSGFATQLFESEKVAQEEKKGIWINYDNEPEESSEIALQAKTEPMSHTDASKSSEPTTKSYIDIILTGVTPDGQVTYRKKSREASFTQLSKDLASFNNASANSTAFNFKSVIKRGELVTVVDSNQYLRGKVLHFEGRNYTVQLLDKGTEVIVGVSQLRPLPSQYSTQAYPSFAESAFLTFVQVPPSSYITDFISYIEGYVNKPVAAKIDAISPHNYVTLYTEDSNGPDESLNSILIHDGYAYAEKNVALTDKSNTWKELYETLQALEDEAKSDRMGVWEYGDARQLD